MQGKCDKLEAACREEESKHWMKMAKLEEKNKALFFYIFAVKIVI